MYLMLAIAALACILISIFIALWREHVEVKRLEQHGETFGQMHADCNRILREWMESIEDYRKRNEIIF